MAALASSLTVPGAAEIGIARDQADANARRTSLRGVAKSGDREAIRKTAEKFEATFLSQMLGHMMKGIKTDGPFGGGNAEGMWRDMYVDQVGQQIVHAGGIGLADAVERQMIMMQEVSKQ